MDHLCGIKTLGLTCQTLGFDKFDLRILLEDLAKKRRSNILPSAPAAHEAVAPARALALQTFALFGRGGRIAGVLVGHGKTNKHFSE